MFINNKYSKYYFNIINNAKSRITIEGYTEKHHIIPKSLGGSNNQDNLVKLTAKEHFICHLLLTKMTSKSQKRSMIYAFNALSTLRNSHQLRYNSRLYQLARKLFSKEQSKLMSTDLNPMRGKTHSVKSREKMSKTRLGKKQTWLLGKKLSKETREKISKSNKGEKNYMFGKHHSTESKKKMSDKKKGHSYNKGIPKTDEHRKKLSLSLRGIPFTDERKEKLKNIPKISCKYCNKLFRPNMHKRWHGENCKYKG